MWPITSLGRSLKNGENQVFPSHSLVNIFESSSVSLGVPFSSYRPNSLGVSLPQSVYLWGEVKKGTEVLEQSRGVTDLN